MHPDVKMEDAMKLADREEYRRGSVAVVGGINLDVSVRSELAPGPGETVLGTSKLEGLGGKGANQAVAAARAGAQVGLVGLVGGDRASSMLDSRLRAARVDISGVGVLPDATTGTAIIVVTDDGENRIVVVPGANGQVTTEYVETNSSFIAAAAVLVVQGELPTAASRSAIRIAAENGCRVVVNLAPVVSLGIELEAADPLIVNTVEAAQLTGIAADDVAAILLNRDYYSAVARSVVVSVGSEGAIVIDEGVATHLPAPAGVVARDTTGAGDALVGVVAAHLAHGDDLLTAVAAGVEAASSTVSTLGAAEAYPDFANRAALQS